MWSMDYVQIPNAKPEIAEEAKEESIIEETVEERKEKKKAELVKQMSLSTDERGKKYFLGLLPEIFNVKLYLLQPSLSLDPNRAYLRLVIVLKRQESNTRTKKTSVAIRRIRLAVKIFFPLIAKLT